jgi:hypothetical protein
MAEHSGERHRNVKTGDRKEFLLQDARFPIANACHCQLVCYAVFDLASIHIFCAVKYTQLRSCFTRLCFSLLVTRECRDWSSFGAELMLHSVLFSEVPLIHCV